MSGSRVCPSEGQRRQAEPGQHGRRDFNVNKRYQLYTSTRAVVRYQNLVGDRYLEITSGPGELRKLPPGATIPKQNTEPALDLDALLGGLQAGAQGPGRRQDQRGEQCRHRTAAGSGRRAVDLLSSTSAFTSNLAARDQLIGDVINNLNTVLGTVDEKGAQFNASVDQLQQLITGLAAGRDPIAGAIAPLASAENDLTDMLQKSRRPLQGVIENTPAAGPAARRAQGRRQQGHRAAGRELSAAQRPGRIRLVLQHLLLLDPDKDQRTRRQRHPDSVRRPSGPVEGEVLGQG